MSGIMRPVGPEPSETYWMRRALVVGSFLVLLIIILLFLFNLGGGPGRAAPADTPSQARTAPTAPSTELSSAPSARSITPSAEPSEESSNASASSSADSSARPSSDPTTNGKPSPSTEPDSTKSGEPSDADHTKKPEKQDQANDEDNTEDKAQDEAQDKAQDKEQAAPEKDEPAKPRFADCDPNKLRATIKSDKHNVGVRDKVAFELSVINGGEQPCTLELDTKNYELKIYSGTDRIWSSNDCARREPDLHKIMQPEQQVEWSMTWNGKRSDEDADCKARPEIPKPGYYYATSAIKGAEPVQFLLVLR